MNMLLEGLQERGALVIVPASVVDTMNLGGLGAGVRRAPAELRAGRAQAAREQPAPEGTQRPVVLI
ncbi:MAG: hypothetical protein JSV36_00270 [Anaerolineae bacterium]|nr:MAG: hypothetical protein JSV36_00270 [Anaerolineae bacterium]